jgi:hypothetical protein
MGAVVSGQRYGSQGVRFDPSLGHLFIIEKRLLSSLSTNELMVAMVTMQVAFLNL